MCVCAAGAKVHFESSLVRVIQSDGSASEHSWPPADQGEGLPTAVEALVTKAKMVRRGGGGESR